MIASGVTKLLTTTRSIRSQSFLCHLRSCKHDSQKQQQQQQQQQCITFYHHHHHLQQVGGCSSSKILHIAHLPLKGPRRFFGFKTTIHARRRYVKRCNINSHGQEDRILCSSFSSSTTSTTPWSQTNSTMTDVQKQVTGTIPRHGAGISIGQYAMVRNCGCYLLGVWGSRFPTHYFSLALLLLFHTPNQPPTLTTRTTPNSCNVPLHSKTSIRLESWWGILTRCTHPSMWTNQQPTNSCRMMRLVMTTHNNNLIRSHFYKATLITEYCSSKKHPNHPKMMTRVTMTMKRPHQPQDQQK